ncbi:GNAT family N-acetyltransferase [Nocardioides pantholopis]|uniref:GNAT family N-acetyltransferase n=1 Tax=Nocardioides pantholopis TaxID=2483798 RepID=UPI001F1554F3|nr:GNAT family N-acetyltransferase [Nocardioides pantholopis]
MTRTLVTLREAALADAPFLTTLWKDTLRRVDRQEQLADIELVIKSAEESAECRLLVAELDACPAGAVYLRVTTMSGLNLEPIVQAVSPHVLPEHRRRGIGRHLMEAAVSFAEEVGVHHVATAAASGSRDANRFMARLALGPLAVLRVAPTHVVRARLTAQQPGLQRHGGRQLGHVLAARRSMRRAHAAREA